MGQRRQGHGGARVAGVGLLGSIHGQPTDDIDAKLLDIGAGTNEIRRMLIGRELIGA